MIKLQATATKDYELMSLLYKFKTMGVHYYVRPSEEAESKYTKEGKPIRWIEINSI